MPFRIVRNDITRVAADAIVNTANPEPCFGSGTDAAVYKAAGEEKLLAARKKIGRIAPGECAVTPAFGLPAKYIIHTVGPAWTDGAHGEFEILRSCYRKALLLADQLGCESIAFPLIATGVYGFPKDKALEIALDVIRGHLEESDLDVTLVVFGRSSYQVAQGLSERVEAYIDEKYVRAQTAAEYGTEAEERLYERLSERREAARVRQEYRDAASYPGNAFPSAGAPLPQMSLPPAMSHASAAMPQAPLPKAAKPGPVPSAPLPASSAKAKKPSLDEVTKHLGESFQTRLLRMIDDRGLKDAQVYRRANLSRQVFSRIRCNADYIPTKRTVLALAIGLELNLDDAKDLLASAGYALTDNSLFDVIVSYFIEHEDYNIVKVNEFLFDYGQPYLGSSMD